MKKKPYPNNMLPNVDYDIFTNDSSSLIDLEVITKDNFLNFLDELEDALIDENMAQTPELMIAHLGAYLGSSVAVFNNKDSKSLIKSVSNLIETQAAIALEKFNTHPINDGVDSELQKANFNKLKEIAPGCITAQTIRISKCLMSTMDRLAQNRLKALSSNLTPKTQKELLCPQGPLFNLLINVLNDQLQEWHENLSDKHINFAINQAAIQLSWLAAYFSHMDQKSSLNKYTTYATTVTEGYCENMYEFLDAMKKNGQILTSINNIENTDLCTDPELEVLLQDIHNLSAKSHAAQPPMIGQEGKEVAVIKAGLEKQIIDLMTQGMNIKLIFMSIFYFWFQLDAPLRIKNLKNLDQIEPFEAMEDIIKIVREMAQKLPEPELPDVIISLNKKMQKLKENLPSPEHFDNVSPEEAKEQSSLINTAIHTLTSDYLKQDCHPEIVANILFMQWLRLSIFYGVSEHEWQKMDFYFTEIIASVREHLSNMA